jgi:hypothetical protein
MLAVDRLDGDFAPDVKVACAADLARAAGAEHGAELVALCECSPRRDPRPIDDRVVAVALGGLDRFGSATIVTGRECSQNARRGLM